jgi:phytoene dehydrogenase-like protein
VRRAGVEASDGVGGRIRTDRFEGFLLDRGFQVLLTAYPECRRELDYGSLDLRTFLPGALIQKGGRFHRLADPWRQPVRALESLLAPVGGPLDKLRVGRLRWKLRRQSIERLFEAEETTTLARLRELGFSESMIAGFFRPFLGGVFLDAQLETSSRMFEFVFKMFAEGDVAVPNGGMQAIPESIAAQLAPGTVRLNARVASVDRTSCTLTTGERIEAERIVVAADGDGASALLSGAPEARWRGTVCLYFDAPEPPFEDPVLLLDGEGSGPANSVAVMSRVAPGYAPAGRSLVSVSLLDAETAEPEALERRVRLQLEDWFGAAVKEWRALRHYPIPEALPRISPSARTSVTEIDGVIVCGDHLESASIQGAMLSGRRAAEAIV